MRMRHVLRGLVAVSLVAGLAVLIPGTPFYLPEWLAGHDNYEGRSSRSWARDLDNPDAATRRDAAFALGAIGEPAAGTVHKLAGLMTADPDRGVRAAASLAIMKIGPSAREVVPAVAQALKDPEPLVRMNAAQTLFRLGPDARPAVPALIEALADEQNEVYADRFINTVQEVVVLALGRATAGTDQAVSALTQALQSAKTNAVRRAACRALGDVGPPAAPALPVLREYQKGTDKHVREAAEKAVRRIEGDKPAARRPAEAETALLPEDERKYLWEIEHRGNVLVKKGFGRLSAALRQGDTAALDRLLASDFTATDLGDGRRVRATREFATVERVTAAGGEPRPLDRVAFLARLADIRRGFAEPPRVKIALKTFHPKRRGDLTGPWEGTAQLQLAGEHAVGAPAETVVSIRFEVPAPTDETLAAPGWLRRAGLDQTLTARAPHYLFAETSAARGLKTDRLHDNWAGGGTVPTAGGVYVCDFDRDGWLDVLITDVTGSTLYRGRPGGVFEDVTVAYGLPDPTVPTGSVSAAWIDIDGDGWEDLLLDRQVYRNDRGIRFTDVTRRTNLRLPDNALGLVVADYDRDGKLDLYVTRAARSKTGAWVEGASSDAPGNVLYRNRGDWQFENVTRASGTWGGGRSTFTAAWLDANNDGWPDLYIGNEFGDGHLLVNQGNGTFTGRPMADRPTDFGTMGLAAGDVNNDGHIDIYSANMYSKAGTRVISNLRSDAYPPVLMEKLRRFVAGSQLHLNRGGLRFDQVGADAQVAAVGWAYGPCLADLDGDGFLDLYATAGYISRSRDEPDG